MRHAHVRRLSTLALVGIAAAMLAGCFNRTVSPDQVTGVTTTANTLSRVTVSWEMVTDTTTPPEEMTYEVHWSATPGQSTDAFAAVATVSGETSVVIEGIPGYTSVYFAVRAVNEANVAGLASEEVSTTTTASQAFVDGEDAVIDALGSSYHAVYLRASSIGQDVYLNWKDEAGLQMNGAVLTAAATAFVPIMGEDYNYSSAAGADQLIIAGAEFSPLRSYRYNPAPADDWTEVTGSAGSGVTDTAVELATIDGAVHLARLSDDGVTQTAEVLSFDGSDWTPLPGGPVLTGSAPVWNANPLLLAGSNGTTYVAGEQDSNGIVQIFKHTGGSWTDVSSADWNANTAALDLVMLGDTAYLVAVDTLVLEIWEYSGSGSGWTKVVSDGRYNSGEAVESATAAALNGTLYVSWNETAAGVYRARVGAYTASAPSPAWQIIDGTGADGLNSDPLNYDARQPTLLAHNGSVLVFFTENTGTISEALIRAYAYE